MCLVNDTEAISGLGASDAKSGARPTLSGTRPIFSRDKPVQWELKATTLTMACQRITRKIISHAKKIIHVFLLFSRLYSIGRPCQKSG
ncbi:unnamed protein product [Leptosia nina]|uniref:Uncharacterized protein n=1 Tax=Leptosia nina TaxID=320188 RepID=A0AAV1JFY2_9NEOP